MRRHFAVLAAIALATLALLASACGSSSSSSGGSASTTSTTTSTGDSIDGAWTLTSYLTGSAQTPAAATPATVTFSTGAKFAGTTGCNNLAGTWTGSANGPFTITPGPMTQMACADPAVTAQETALTTGLAKVTDSTLSGTTLTMQDSSGNALFTWTRGPDGIEGSYQVTGINNGNQAVVSTEATSKASITFGPDGTVSGNTGCNSFSGSYTIDGSSLEINGDVAATMMACEDASQQVETQFLTALSEVASWERNGQTVTLRDPAGATQLTLTPAA
jgi:heat shock protein HslJ